MGKDMIPFQPMQSHQSFLKRCRQLALASEAGFSLLEVLIALVVLSLGVLGIAAMQTLALTGSQGGYLRTQAVLQAYDMTDRMRANPDGVGSGFYNSIPYTLGSSVVCTSCTPEQIRDNDHNSWNTRNANLLPNGKGTVTSINTTDFDIAITWDDRSNPQATQQELKVTVRL